jgi:hypothetical protein
MGALRRAPGRNGRSAGVDADGRSVGTDRGGKGAAGGLREGKGVMVVS